jgi:hypothetical protein
MNVQSVGLSAAVLVCYAPITHGYDVAPPFAGARMDYTENLHKMDIEGHAFGARETLMTSRHFWQRQKQAFEKGLALAEAEIDRQ